MLKVKTKPEAIFGLLWRMFLPVNFRSFNALEDYGEDYDDDEVDDAGIRIWIWLTIIMMDEDSIIHKHKYEDDIGECL